jgi:hypothetical protein
VFRSDDPVRVVHGSSRGLLVPSVRRTHVRPAEGSPRRILVATDGTWGDVGPFLAVGARLRARGHEVRAILDPSFAHAVLTQLGSPGRTPSRAAATRGDLTGRLGQV